MRQLVDYHYRLLDYSISKKDDVLTNRLNAQSLSLKSANCFHVFQMMSVDYLVVNTGLEVESKL